MYSSVFDRVISLLLQSKLKTAEREEMSNESSYLQENLSSVPAAHEGQRQTRRSFRSLQSQRRTTSKACVSDAGKQDQSEPEPTSCVDTHLAASMHTGVIKSSPEIVLWIHSNPSLETCLKHWSPTAIKVTKRLSY